MKDAYTEYQEKLISADEAASLVKSGDKIFYSEFVLFPEVLDEALAKRIHLLKNIDLRSVCFTRVPKIVEADPERKRVIMNDWHFGTTSRRLHDANMCNYIPLSYHQGPRTIRKYRDFDVAFILVGEMDKNGYFNYGLSNSLTGAVLSKSRRIIVEVNKTVPYCYGGNRESIHVSQVDYIVEGNNTPLAEVKSQPPKEIDRRIAEHIMKEIEDGACLQLGIGGLPNLIGQLIAESDLKDLGIHTEMLVDSCVDLYKAGRITGRKKSVDHFKMAYTFAMGTKKLYDFLDRNPTCASYPVNYINDPRIIALNNKVVAINNAIEVDLYGQVCSESVGPEQKSGTGGQLDFIFGAFQSKGGKGIISLSSTYKDKDGKLHSRIVPFVEPGSIVTVPRSIVQYVATEYGIVQLKGKSTWERAESLISIAHPDFREELISQADKMKIWIKGK
ncbi:MAG TPA: acetyl-CoA hydrolase/transferase C-terminal domain-containing protein [Smithella sp.]|nr:acetyl-CoA hydrolase/transferase C-terminal domain-containing protein [Smithella sp.]